MQKQVPISDLRIGMFVAELDRPWLDSPFLFQGFLVENQEELGKIQELCEIVTVDVEKSSVEHGGRRNAPKVAHSAVDQRISSTVERFRDAFRSFRLVHQDVQLGVIKILDDRRLGQLVETGMAKSAVENLVHGVLKDPSASLWLARLKSSDEYTQAHSLNVAILSVAFAKHRGLPEATIEAIGLGAVLHDIGLSHVATDILRKKAKLSEAEFEQVRAHPVLGIDSLEDPDRLPDVTRDIIRWHHEHVDGSGYPDQLMGDEIPEHVRIVAIADTYDAMVSDRSYRRGLLPADALQEILRESEKTVGREIAESFIRSIGIYPAGSVVKLNTGALAVVVTSNESARLSPLVMMLTTNDGEPLQPHRLVDLSRTMEKIGERWFVSEIVDPGTCGIDVESLGIDDVRGV